MADDMERATAITGTGATGAFVSAAGSVPAELDNFDALVLAEQRRIYGVLLASVGDPDTAENLTQECFLQAYRHRESFRGEASPRTWLVRIAMNLARDYWKSRRWAFWRRLRRDSDGTEPLQLVAPQLSPEAALVVRERLKNVWAVIARLSPQQRTAFVLRFVEEMSIEEIAAAMSLRPGTVKAHLFRALGAVREQVKEQAQ